MPDCSWFVAITWLNACTTHSYFFYILVERSTDTSTEPLSLAGQYYKLLQQIKDANYLRSFVVGHDVPVSIAIGV